MFNKFVRLRFFILLLVLFTFSCKKDSAPTDAPVIVTKISGIVTNKVTGAAISGAQITTTPVTSTITTDANGKYEFTKISAGSFVVKSTKNGFLDAQIATTVTEGNTSQADIQMEELTGRLDVSPVFLDFGTADNQKIIAISNSTGIGTVNFTLSKNVGWLTLSESAGSITTNVKNITLTVDRSQVTYGTFNDVVTIASNVGNVLVNLQMVKQNPNAPQLTVSPIILDFGTSQNDLSITMSNTGTGTINWNANSTDGWISIVPSSGSITNSAVTTSVRVIRAGLPPNNLNGSVVFSSNGGNQTVSVKMNIPAVPVLSLIPTAIDFGTADSIRSIQLSNIGTGTLNWNIVSNQSWLTVSNAQGTNSSVVSVNIHRGNLSQGTYSGILSFTSNGGNIQANVLMTVPAPQPPDPVTLSNPSNITINSCKLNWTSSSASDFVSYKVFQSSSADVNETSTLVTTITNSATTNYAVNGLSGSTAYYFRIYVVSSKGISAGSNIVNATTLRQLGSWMSTSTIPQISGSDVHTNSLFCIYDNNIWLAEDYFNSSSDFGANFWHYSGASWIKDTALSSAYGVQSIIFLNANLGWAVGRGGIHSYNGSTWTLINSPVIGSTFLYDIVATSASDIWVSGAYGLLFHFDGITWTKFTISASTLVSLSLISRDNIWVADNYGKVFNYNGIGWVSKGQISTNNSYFNKIKAISNTDIWISNGSGSSTGSGLWHYDGTTFSPNYKTTASNYGYRNTLEMVSSNEGWSSNSNGLSYFDGNSWRDVTIPISSAVSCIKMINSKTGWAVGANGEVLRYKE